MTDSSRIHPGFHARLAEVARRFGVTGFWPWWTRELDALVPSAPRAAIARRRMRPGEVFDGAQATLWRPVLDNGRALMTTVATISLGGDIDEVANRGRAALASLTPVVPGASAPVRVVLSLAQRDVLRKRIALPAAVEENFRQALAYDLDRHTPFKPDELYFDAAIVERNAARNTITVDLAAVRRSVADPALKAAAAWGADVIALVPEPPATASTSRLNLLPRAAASGWSAWARWQLLLPAGLLAGLLLASVAIPLWQKREYAIQMIGLANQARVQAAVSEGLRQELDARTGDYNAALERKYAYPSALHVVDSVSKLLPDDTWLTQFELKTMAKGKDTQRELLVRGESANAGRLVQLFEESQMFAQAAPRSPITKIQPGPGEIFDLGAQLKPIAAPAPMLVLTSGASVPAPAAPAPAPGVANVPVAPAPSAATNPAAPAPPAATNAGAAPAPAVGAKAQAPVAAVAPPAAAAPAPGMAPADVAPKPSPALSPEDQARASAKAMRP